MPPSSVVAYAAALTEDLRLASGGLIEGAYLHGSAALGGWLPSSDVDLLFVAADGVGGATPDLVARSLADDRRSCPGRGLECSVVRRSAAAAPRPPWPYLVHVATGAAEPGGSRIHFGADSPGDGDLLMHYAVCRAAGWPVYGPPPEQIIGPVARQQILAYLAGELCWGLDHAPEAYAVLNACRALVYLSDGQIMSKVDGGQTALRRRLGPPGLIRRALAQQQGRAAEQQPGADAAAFVLAAAAALNDAADASG